MSNQESRLSKLVYIMPFGRHQPGGTTDAEAAKVLIGRDEQRQKFVDRLLGTPRRGAFLVTGQRGIGKSSFVRNCLCEYREAVFERFLLSNVGRAFFWDRIAVLALAVTAIVLALMLSELSEYLVQAAPADEPLAWLVIAPLALICAYPLLYAREVLVALVDTLASTFRADRSTANETHGTTRSGLIDLFLKVIPTLATLASMILLWYAGPFGAPAVSMARFFVAFAWLCFLHELLALCGAVEQRWAGGAGARDSGRILDFVIGLLPLLAAMLTIFVGLRDTTGHSVTVLIQGRALVGFVVVGVAQIMHCATLAVARKSNWSARLSFAFGGFLLLAVLPICKLHPECPPFWNALLREPIVSLWSLVALLPAALVWYWGRRRRSPGTQPENSTSSVNGHAPDGTELAQASTVMLLVALLSVVVALHLTYPVVAHVATRIDPPSLTAAPSALRTPQTLASLLGKIQEADGTGGSVKTYLAIQAFWQIAAEPWWMGAELMYLLNSSEPPVAALFHRADEEWAWLAGLLLVTLLVYYLQYAWLLRPLRRQAGAAPPCLLPLAKLSMPWLLYERWLPILIIPVNLGFERLDHRRVVQAMLTGLRTGYERLFLGWRSPYARARRLVSGALLLVLVNLAGQRWFGLPDLDAADARGKSKEYVDICAVLRGAQNASGIVVPLCHLESGNLVVHLLYTNLMFSARPEHKRTDNPLARHLIFSLLPWQKEPWPSKATSSEAFLQVGVHFRVYHVLLLVLLYASGRALARRLPMLPHKTTLRAIDALLARLLGNTSFTSSSRFAPVQWLRSAMVNDVVQQNSQDALDPRTVEFEFMTILEDIASTALRVPGSRTQVLHVPTAEVIFVFDELDKLGVRAQVGDDLGVGNPEQQRILDSHRRHAADLHSLLADMKNMLSAAPARFVFVGGREMHDEWLADQTSRQPLLTNVFDTEIYFPSLLTDHGSAGATEAPLQSNVGRYLDVQFERGRHLDERLETKRIASELSLTFEAAEPERFVDVRGTSAGPSCGNLVWSGPLPHAGHAEDQYQLAEDKTWRRDLEQFLAYRSHGNPTRLRELLANFVRSRTLLDVPEKLDDGSAGVPAGQHVLAFSDADRFRVRFIARLFRHLDAALRTRMVQRDDQMAVSAFYLSDFLLKFHRRAFSWVNLERVDELVHIHRAPDLRAMLETIVTRWDGRFLHPIPNGMYDYRFRSDLAIEVDHLSRLSPEEMAAFNFTLDESQALKALFEVTIGKLREGGGAELRDLYAGLGELYEFDQEYETARLYYRRALDLLDAELRRLMSDEAASGALRETTAAPAQAWDALSATRKGRHMTRRHLSWGVARLRLMLQVAMTYEISRNYERALVAYRDAGSLATAFLVAVLDPQARPVLLDRGATATEASDRLNVAKHLTLLFQPMFAEAWVAEKLTGGVDTSMSIVEEGLWRLRHALPFVRELDARIEPAGSLHEARHSNFALVAAELHNKAGDLYFFKGRQVGDAFPTDPNVDKDGPKKEYDPQKGTEGYLHQAHYHYAVALHELRRFTIYRRESSAIKLNVWPLHGPARRLPTLRRRGWPSFVWQAAANSLADMAEAMLARVSLGALLQNLERRDAAATVPATAELTKKVLGGTRGRVQDWFDGPTDEPRQEGSSRTGLDDIVDVGSLEGWLGTWSASRGTSSDRLLSFDAASPSCHDDAARLLTALVMSDAAAKCFADGGQAEDAAQVQLGICETVSRILWWLLSLRHLGEGSRSTACQLLGHKYARHLAALAVHAAEEMNEHFRESRRRPPRDAEPQYLIGDQVPVLAFVTVESLRRAIRCAWPGDETAPLKRLLASWAGAAQGATVDEDRALQQVLVRHPYPALTRLQGIATLILDAALPSAQGSERPTGAQDDTLLDLVHELLELESSLRAPWHFPPIHAGLCCALAYWSCDEAATRADEATRAATDVSAAAKAIECAVAKLRGAAALVAKAEDAARRAKKAAGIAEKAAVNVGDAASTANEATEHAQRAANCANDLAGKAKEIADVSGDLASLAQRAIEAAQRAKEVVTNANEAADSVGKMASIAQRVAKATRHAKKAVDCATEVADSVGNVASVWQCVTDAAEKAKAAADCADAAAGKVKQAVAVDQATSIAQRVTAALAEQARGAVGAVGGAASIAQRVAQAAERTKEAARRAKETVDAVGDAALIAQRVAQAAERTKEAARRAKETADAVGDAASIRQCVAQMAERAKEAADAVGDLASLVQHVAQAAERAKEAVKRAKETADTAGDAASTAQRVAQMAKEADRADEAVNKAKRAADLATSALAEAQVTVQVAAPRFQREALRRLEEAEQMFTMRRAFYEHIGSMYYLYDDFSDRRIHLSASQQMLASDVIEELCQALGRPPRHQPPPPTQAPADPSPAAPAPPLAVTPAAHPPPAS